MFPTLVTRASVPRTDEAPVSYGPETDPASVGADREELEAAWKAVTRLYASGLERQNQCSRSGVGPNRVLDAKIRCKFRFKCFDKRSNRKFTSFDESPEVSEIRLHISKLFVQIGVFDRCDG